MDKISFLAGPRLNIAVWSSEYLDQEGFIYALHLLYTNMFVSFDRSNYLCRNFYKL